MVRNKFVLISVLIIFITVFYYTFSALFNKKSTYKIALVGPMSGENSSNGKAMSYGINLFLEQLKQNSEIDFDIKLVIYDDENSVEKAHKIALDIASDHNILMVIGHYYSSTSIAAGKVYQKAGIPAITASATSEGVIRDNKWYFRIIPGNAFQGSFIANYIHSVLKKKTVIIISDRDSYGSDLAQNFEKAARALKMKYKKIIIDSNTLDRDLDTIINQLREIKETGMVFIATHMPEAATIITSIKYPGAKFPILGPDSIASSAFIEYLKKKSFQERSIPGYHSNGIFAISPFIIDISGEKAQIFRKQFREYCKKDPTWVAACYFDAISVAAHAIQKINSHQPSNIELQRKQTRNFLNQMGGYEKGIDGVTGRIFFTNQEVLRPFAVGFFKNQKLISAASQYQQLSVEKDSISILKQILEGQTIDVNDVLMSKLRLVYTGIDINEISELNITEGTYLVDFYLWFRYEEEFMDAEQIEFVNSLKPLFIDNDITKAKNKNISLVLNQKKNGIIIRAYNVRAKFKNKFDLHKFPFDSQTLCIKFRHSKYTKDNLIFIADIIGMRQFIKNEYSRDVDSYSLSGWELQDPIFFQDFISNSSSLGNPDMINSKNTIMFSQFNANIPIKREVISFLSKNVCLILVMLITSYIIYFIPPDQFAIRISIGMSTLLTTAFAHSRLTQRLPVSYLMAMEHIYFGVYLLSMISIVVSVTIYQCYKKSTLTAIDKVLRYKSIKKIGYYTHFGLILHPTLSIIVIYNIINQYMPEKVMMKNSFLVLIPLATLIIFFIYKPFINSRSRLTKLEIFQDSESTSCV